MSRLVSGEIKNANGKIVPLRGDKVPYGSPNSADLVARFLRTKLSPAPGAVLNHLTGKDVVGNEVTMGTTAKNMLVPLSMQDILKTMEAQGVDRGTAMALLSLLGMSLQTYDEKNKVSASNAPVYPSSDMNDLTK
jgi:hypothetical protein